MIDRAIDAWRRFVPGSPRITRTQWYAGHADLPAGLPRRTLALVGGTAQSPKWALMECPCATGHRIALPLQRTVGAVWKVSIDRRGVPGINPSIDSREEFRCHFWLRDGRIHWSPDRAHGRLAAQ